MTRAASFSVRTLALVALGTLQLYWFSQPHVPLALKIFVGLATALSLLRPDAGLMVFAAVAPISSFLGTLAGESRHGTWLVQELIFGVAAGALLKPLPRGERTWIGAPALLTGVIALASAVAMVPAELTATTPPGLIRDDGFVLRQLLDARSALPSHAWSPVFTAVAIAASALAGWAAERIVRLRPQLASRLVLISLAGHAGAGLLNFERLRQAALRTNDALQTLSYLLRSFRVSMQSDVHSAASALLLAGVAAFGVLTGSWLRKMGVAILMALVLAGLWITGSRVALGLAVISFVGLGAWPLVRRSRYRWLIGVVALGCVVAGMWATMFYPTDRYYTVSRSISSRMALINAGVAMFKSAPLFGIGITKFYATSAVVGGADLEAKTGYPRENAHNNFVQVLAEQGLVGLAALLFWLGVVVFQGWRAQRLAPDRLRAGLLVAIVACLGTWMTGHPLLVTEFAIVFWLYCGILLGTTPAAAPRRVWPLWIAVAAIVASVPFRAVSARNEIDLEYLGVGLSMWQHDDEQRYRDAGRTFALFLQAADTPVAVPLRRAPGTPDPLVFDVRIGGRPLKTVTLTGDGWQTTMLTIPFERRRFEQVDFAMQQPPGAGATREAVVRVGRTSLTGLTRPTGSSGSAGLSGRSEHIRRQRAHDFGAAEFPDERVSRRVTNLEPCKGGQGGVHVARWKDGRIFHLGFQEIGRVARDSCPDWLAQSRVLENFRRAERA